MCKFQRNRTKNEEVIAYATWVVLWREVYINRPGARRIALGMRVWSKLFYFFFFTGRHLVYYSYLSMSCVTSRADWYGVVAEVSSKEVSNTQDFMEGECRKIALSPASELALPNDNSKHDCAGGKFNLLPGYLTDRDVWWLISKRKIHAM